MTDRTPADKIYLTYKTRMTTEARLRRAALTFHLLLSWYSFCLIIVSILAISGKFELAYSDTISAAFSVMVFGLSLFLYGERYNERADQIKACYLELKKLYECDEDIDYKIKSYSKILDRYENQSDTDFDEMVFDAFLRHQKLYNSQGEVRLSWYIFAKVAGWRIFRSLITVVLFIAPVMAGLFWITPVAPK